MNITSSDIYENENFDESKKNMYTKVIYSKWKNFSFDVDCQ